MFVCLFVFRLGYFIYFLCFEPPEAISSGLLLVYFWCLRCFIFFAFPLKRFHGLFSFFCVGGRFLVDHLLCFEPPESDFGRIQPQPGGPELGLGLNQNLEREVQVVAPPSRWKVQ